MNEKLKNLFSGKNIYFIWGIFLAIGIAILVTLFAFGGTYKDIISFFSTEKPKSITRYITKKRKIIKRISIRKKDEEECVEVTPDGIVRVYSECGEELISAQRLPDINPVSKLFKQFTTQDLHSYQNLGEGELYEVTLITDEGTETYYIVANDDMPDIVEEIIETIESIEDQIIIGTPVPSTVLPSPTLPPGATPPLYPSPTVYQPISSPRPSSTPVSEETEEVHFICDYDEETEIKPFNVSNFICSSEPELPTE